MSELAVIEHAGNGAVIDMAGGTGEMASRLAEMKGKLGLVKDFFKSIMEKDLDYGIIPGTDKPTLFKPGAEKLNELYGFASLVKEKKETRDIASGYYHAEVTIQIIHRSTGMIIAEGIGEACSYESKYRYRWVFESDVPKGLDKGTLITKTFESKKTGKEYAKYRLENNDLIDQWNTVLKMAKKRALVDATLSATRTSGIFSQSEDEMDAWLEGETDERLTKKKTPPPQQEAPTSQGGIDGPITPAQEAKIIGDAKRKGVDEAGIRAIVLRTKKKTLDKLTKKEASSVIEFLLSTDTTELKAMADEPPAFSAEELGDA